MSYGSRCDNCGGEDCVCCEVYLEAMADEHYEREYQPDYDDYDDGRYASIDEDY